MGAEHPLCESLPFEVNQLVKAIDHQCVGNSEVAVFHLRGQQFKHRVIGIHATRKSTKKLEKKAGTAMNGKKAGTAMNGTKKSWKKLGQQNGKKLGKSWDRKKAGTAMNGKKLGRQKAGTAMSPEHKTIHV